MTPHAGFMVSLDVGVERCHSFEKKKKIKNNFKKMDFSQ